MKRDRLGRFIGPDPRHPALSDLEFFVHIHATALVAHVDIARMLGEDWSTYFAHLPAAVKETR